MLEEKRLFILDMDGTVYLGDRLFPQTLPFLRHIKETGGAYIFFTNNASRSRKTYEGRLASMGIPATPLRNWTGPAIMFEMGRSFCPPIPMSTAPWTGDIW